MRSLMVGVYWGYFDKSIINYMIVIELFLATPMIWGFLTFYYDKALVAARREFAIRKIIARDPKEKKKGKVYVA